MPVWAETIWTYQIVPVLFYGELGEPRAVSKRLRDPFQVKAVKNRDVCPTSGPLFSGLETEYSTERGFGMQETGFALVTNKHLLCQASEI